MFYPQERDEQARKEWLEDLAKLDVKKLIFLDETSSFVNMSRSYGWTPCHERLVDSFPKGKKQRVSLIAAIGLHANLAEHAMLHPESVDKNAFKAYLENVLLPKLEPGTTLIMDNWKVHHGSDITELVETFGCKVFYLPTYSPDFNPIEYLFGKIKAFIKKLRPLNLSDLLDVFSNAAKAITLQHISNAFTHCGYSVQ
jgi:transposase